MTMFKKTKNVPDLLDDPSAQYFMNKVDYLMTFSVSHHYRFIIFSNLIIKKKLKTILDVGCGYAALPKYLEDFKFTGSYLGLDLNKEYLKKIRKKKYSFKTSYSSSKIEELDNTKFDCIVLGEMIEHIEPQEKALDFLLECKKRLSKNGSLLIATPNKIKNQLVNPDNHFDEFTYSSLSEVCKKAGFKIEKTMGFWSNTKDTLAFLTVKEKKRYEEWSMYLPNSVLNVYFNLLNPRNSRDMIFILKKS